MMRAALVLRFALGIAVALAATPAAALFVVNEPWVRVATDQRSAEVYMRLTSTDGATLVGVASGEGDSVEVCAPGAARSMAKSLALPAGELVALAPKAYRVVLRGLHRKLKLGDRVMLTLTIEDRDGKRMEIPVDAEVRRRSPTEDHMRHKG